jgi:PPOX class probable F420-dependent enzyme
VNLRAQLVMSDDEVRAFLARPLTLTVCTLGRDHTIHAVPVYYGFVGDDVAFHTKAKSQKVCNLRRHGTITCSAYDGSTPDELCGVTIIGRAVLFDDAPTLRALSDDIIRRYASDDDPTDADAVFEEKVRNRVGVRVRVERVISFDHAKAYGPRK